MNNYQDRFLENIYLYISPNFSCRKGKFLGDNSTEPFIIHDNILRFLEKNYFRFCYKLPENLKPFTFILIQSGTTGKVYKIKGIYENITNDISDNSYFQIEIELLVDPKDCELVKRKNLILKIEETDKKKEEDFIKDIIDDRIKGWIINPLKELSMKNTEENKYLILYLFFLYFEVKFQLEDILKNNKNDINIIENLLKECKVYKTEDNTDGNSYYAIVCGINKSDTININGKTFKFINDLKEIKSNLERKLGKSPLDLKANFNIYYKDSKDFILLDKNYIDEEKVNLYFDDEEIELKKLHNPSYLKFEDYANKIFDLYEDEEEPAHIILVPKTNEDNLIDINRKKYRKVLEEKKRRKYLNLIYNRLRNRLAHELIIGSGARLPYSYVRNKNKALYSINGNFKIEVLIEIQKIDKNEIIDVYLYNFVEYIEFLLIKENNNDFNLLLTSLRKATYSRKNISKFGFPALGLILSFIEKNGNINEFKNKRNIFNKINEKLNEIFGGEGITSKLNNYLISKCKEGKLFCYGINDKIFILSLEKLENENFIENPKDCSKFPIYTLRSNFIHSFETNDITFDINDIEVDNLLDFNNENILAIRKCGNDKKYYINLEKFLEWIENDWSEFMKNELSDEENLKLIAKEFKKSKGKQKVCFMD